MKSRYVIFWLTSLLVRSLSGFVFSNAVVKVKHNEVYISLPGRLEGVQSTLFQAEVLNDECVNNNYSYTSQRPWQTKLILPKNITRNAQLRVHTLMEGTNNVISSVSSVYTIDKDGLAHLDASVSYKKNIDVAKCKPVKVRGETLTKSTKTYRKNIASGDLIFEDNFNDGQKIEENWTHEVQSHYTGGQYQEYVTFVSDTKNSYISNNTLQINMTMGNYGKQKYFYLEQCTCNKYKCKLACGPTQINPLSDIPPVRSAKIHSKKFSFKFGRVEIRARMAKGNWLFPYLALQPKKFDFTESFADQIRLYARGNALLQDKGRYNFDGRSLFGSALIWNAKPRIRHKDNWVVKTKDDHYFNDFHNYTIIWTKKMIGFKVDGEFFGSITDSTILSRFNNDECYLVLGLTAGGDMNFDDDVLMPAHKEEIISNSMPKAATKFKELIKKDTWEKTSLEIDYVRVYAIDKDGN